MAHIETGNTIEYEVKSYQVNQTIAKIVTQTLTEIQRKSGVYNTPITNIPESKTKADIETGNTIEYEIRPYQVN